MVSNIHSNSEKKQQTDDLRMIRLTEVMRKVGMGRTWIYNKVASGDFPQPVNYGGRAVVWIESEIDDWLLQQIAIRAAI